MGGWRVGTGDLEKNVKRHQPVALCPMRIQGLESKRWIKGVKAEGGCCFRQNQLNTRPIKAEQAPQALPSKTTFSFFFFFRASKIIRRKGVQTDGIFKGKLRTPLTDAEFPYPRLMGWDPFMLRAGDSRWEGPAF